MQSNLYEADAICYLSDVRVIFDALIEKESDEIKIKAMKDGKEKVDLVIRIIQQRNKEKPSAT